MPCCWSWCLGFYDQWEQEPWSGPHGHRGGCPGERYRRLLDLHRLPLGPSLVSPRAVWRGAREASERVRCFRICRDAGFWN